MVVMVHMNYNIAGFSIYQWHSCVVLFAVRFLHKPKRVLSMCILVSMYTSLYFYCSQLLCHITMYPCLYAFISRIPLLIYLKIPLIVSSIDLIICTQNLARSYSCMQALDRVWFQFNSTLLIQKEITCSDRCIKN
jgi:hypothetical protein